jgi:hypothetical protein
MRGMSRAPLSPALMLFGIFAFIGSIFISVGLLIGLPVWSQLSSFARAEGSVVDYAYNGDMAYPIVQFTTPDGRRWEFEENIGSNPPDFQLEQKVDVRYDPANPRRAFINAFWVVWFLPGFFVLMGGVFALIGFAGLFSVFRHRRVA